jgi:hypothetical protein
MVDNGKHLAYNKYKKNKRKKVYPMAVNSEQLVQLQFTPAPEAKESLSQFLKGLGATSQAGYSLVDMLDDSYYED